MEAKKEGVIGKVNELFQAGKFYKHRAGRSIAILCEIETYKWNKQFIVEEADITGHAVSCMDIDSERNENWLEIGKIEFLRAFKGEYV